MKKLSHGDTKKDSEYYFLYRRYSNIKTRCYNKNSEGYKKYGAKGIEMCEEWKNSYESFKVWALQNGWDESLSIDRINSNGNYEPSNCRWVDDYVQANNKSNNVIIEIDGVKKNLTQWARYYGVNEKTAHTRYGRNKDTKYIFDKESKAPKRWNEEDLEFLDNNKDNMSLKEMSKFLGRTTEAVRNMIRKIGR